MNQNQIYELNSSEFDFSELSLTHPITVAGNTFFTKIHYKGKPLYGQINQCTTKDGIVKNGKKIYCDLMLDNSVAETILWFETLEKECQRLLLGKNSEWFLNSLNESDLENSFLPVIRIYQSGKYYLIRSGVKTNQNEPVIKIFNEHKEMQTIDSVTRDTKLGVILEIQGIRFTTRSFQIEVELKQMLLLKEEETFFEKCVFKSLTKSKGRAVSKESEKKNEKKNEKKKEKETEEETEEENENEKENKKEKEKEKENEKEINAEPVFAFGEMLGLETPDNIRLELFDPQEEEEQEEEETNTLKILEPEPQPQPNQSNQALVLYHNENPGPLLNDSEEKPQGLEPVFEEAAQPGKNVENEDRLNSNELQEMDFTGLDSGVENEVFRIQLKKPKQVFYEKYREARNHAKTLKNAALKAFLEAKKIKSTYLVQIPVDELSDIDEEIEAISDEEEDDE
jgi:hypothetical protein